jgi:hypothetical protein
MTAAAEMKAIINMDDLLKKNTIKLEVTAADNEDLTSKLQVSPAQSKHGTGTGTVTVTVMFSVATALLIFFDRILGAVDVICPFCAVLSCTVLFVQLISFQS